MFISLRATSSQSTSPASPSFHPSPLTSSHTTQFSLHTIEQAYQLDEK